MQNIKNRVQKQENASADLIACVILAIMLKNKSNEEILMEKMLLSLKNLYKILMTNDFPIYSESVINEKNRKGQTLLRFWQNQIADEFRSMPIGRMLWRNDGKRNRYVSNLCNRSLEQKLCTEYAGELSQLITSAALLNQIKRFMTFLSARAYRHDLLLRRIPELLRLCRIDDNRVSEQLVQHVLKHIAPCAAANEPDNLFQAGYLLTVLTIYAAAGDAMDDACLSILRDKPYSMHALWAQYKQKETARVNTVSFLSIHAGILQDNPLPPHRFFGREEELYDLQEMVSANRKCLISGMGGVGKTELLRQLLRLCGEERLADKIVVVPYESGIAESFLRAFPDYQRQESEEGFQAILRMLERQAEDGYQLLVLIDNMNSAPEEDPQLNKLLHLPCSVLVTSRRTAFSGFEVYYIKPPAVSTAALIFRDNFGKPLSQEDRVTLNNLLQNPAICHPLTLRLMARAASSNGWSIAQLADQMREDMTDVTWTEEDQIIRFKRIYRQLYSQIMLSDSCRDVAEMFTLLPWASYTPDFLERYFPHPAGGLQQKLGILEAEGWLEADTDGYSMHPLIAQCLRRKVITEAYLAPRLSTIRQHLPETAMGDENVQYDAQTVRISEIMIHTSELLTGRISRELLLDMMKAIPIPRRTHAAIAQSRLHLRRLVKRCANSDDLVEIRYLTILGNWFFVEVPQSEAVYRRQKESLTVPKQQFLNFCLSNAPTIVYEKPSLAEEMLLEIFCAEALPQQQALAYYHMAAYCYHEGDCENAIRWSREGVDYASAHPECGDSFLQMNLSFLCMQYIRSGRLEEARPILDQLDWLLREDALPIQRSKYADMRALYSLNCGQPEEALSYYTQNAELILEYRGEDSNYFATRAMIGRTLGQLKRYEEALAHLHAARDYFQADGDGYFEMIVCMNIADLYLEQDLPQQALDHLERVRPQAQKLAGSKLEQLLHNCAVARQRLRKLEAVAEPEAAQKT